MTKPITLKYFKEAFLKLDILEKPYIVLCNSDMEEDLKAAVGDKYTIKGCPYMEDEYIMIVMKDSWFGRYIMTGEIDNSENKNLFVL